MITQHSYILLIKSFITWAETGAVGLTGLTVTPSLICRRHLGQATLKSSVLSFIATKSLTLQHFQCI